MARRERTAKRGKEKDQTIEKRLALGWERARRPVEERNKAKRSQKEARSIEEEREPRFSPVVEVQQYSLPPRPRGEQPQMGTLAREYVSESRSHYESGLSPTREYYTWSQPVHAQGFRTPPIQTFEQIEGESRYRQPQYAEPLVGYGSGNRRSRPTSRVMHEQSPSMSSTVYFTPEPEERYYTPRGDSARGQSIANREAEAQSRQGNRGRSVTRQLNK
jgi:hypothetical protein